MNQSIYKIDRQDALHQALISIKKEKSVAVDLEFDSHSYAYGVALCLIQIASPTECFLVDPLAKMELQELYNIFENPEIQKIVHSPGEDLKILHSQNCFPKNVFDTEVVARLLNYEKTSLAALLDEKLGRKIDKGQQRSNWLLRPLSSEQFIYAATDVTSLHDLKSTLVAEAEKKGLQDFVEEEQHALSTTIHSPVAKTGFLKPADLYSLSPHDQYILNAIYELRDETARQINKPSYQIMDDALVRGLASGSILPAELSDVKGVYGKLKNETFIRQLSERLNSIQSSAKAQNLSHLKPGRPRTTTAMRQTRELAEQHKVEIFKPIQNALSVRFGEHTARFLLSNALVNDILKKEISIKDLKRNYKQQLIMQTAKDLGIDLKDYL